MRFVNDALKAVVLMACEKHAPAIMEKLGECPEGNWFVMPAIQACRMGYWNNVSTSHESKGSAIFGFAESVSLSRTLQQLSSHNSDGSLCPDCVAYEWGVTSSHLAANAVDPVCGAKVSSADSLSQCHEGELFFFCSVTCRDRFHTAPDRYLKTAATAK